MEGKKIIRTIISVGLLVALLVVIFVSQEYDPNNPHSTIPREEYIYGENGHGFAVNNNQNPQRMCYECHTKQGLGGKDFCLSCHDATGVDYDLPEDIPLDLPK